ncbi:MAG TPA: YbhB/YbcL family Raf kinase inhibitor-like protein [Verrucomicrobiae bacterium]
MNRVLFLCGLCLWLTGSRALAEPFILSSGAFTNGGCLPVRYTGDGEGISPPLTWQGAPPSTKAYALIMDHYPGPGDVKWYWILYNIPPETKVLPADAHGIGRQGINSVNGQATYAPPHSRGPGPKIYHLTLYALSAPLPETFPPTSLDRDELLNHMRGLILAQAKLQVIYDRSASLRANPTPPPPP